MNGTAGGLSITRVANACVLLELGNDAVLTDPYFEDHWFMRMKETVGNFRKTRFIGLGVNQVAAYVLASAYNLLRIAKLTAAA